MDSLGAKETGDGIADYLRNPSSASTCSKEQKVAKEYSTSQNNDIEALKALMQLF
jgi:hypothetical protein